MAKLKLRKEASSSEGGVILKLKEEAMEAMDLLPHVKPKAKKETQPAGPVRKRKTKVVKKRLPPALLEYMMANPYKPVDEIPQESLATLDQDFLEGYTLRKFVADKHLAYEQALVEQYLTKGYAEDETEVTDDDEED